MTKKGKAIEKTMWQIVDDHGKCIKGGYNSQVLAIRDKKFYRLNKNEKVFVIREEK